MTPKWYVRSIILCLLTFLTPVALGLARGQAKDEQAKYIRDHYTKQEVRIPMRDGVHLFTAVYSPKDTSQKYPILMLRTPYSVSPYGTDDYPDALGPNHHLVKEGYIFVNQDVRGCFMSEGRFNNMTPHRDKKTSKKDIDESSDTYDTIEWLLANVPNHNGRVGQWGISYPGFYTAAGMIDAHPALKAVSPQAPIADWFFDDFHHHGAFFLPHTFNFFAVFGQPRPEPTARWLPRFDHGTPDGYQFFLDLGPLKNVNERYFKDRVSFWNRIVDHPNYDEFWQKRNLLPHLKKVAPAVMTVGGWFDAEDLYGALKIYRAVEKQNPGVFNVLVMGPWQHGGWHRSDGDRLGNIQFGAKTARFYQEHMEAPFFEHFLKDKGAQTLPEAYLFETGVNRWRKFDVWPPPNLQQRTLYIRGGGKLSFAPPGDEGDVYDEYLSDPSKPVPFTEAIANSMTVEYMTDDQRFAARRPDVLIYQTDVLKQAVTLAGPLVADLRVATSGTDSDWVVKLIDVFPNYAEDYPDMARGEHLGGYQMMVRSEVIRGRFRNSYEHPEPFIPNEPARVSLELQDVLHTFGRGHRIMMQVQSTWFPLVDRNPQKYVDNIYRADEKDFIRATQRVYRSRQQPTCLRVGVLATLPE
jgi:putative CocE/NonD family hydrolase